MLSSFIPSGLGEGFFQHVHVVLVSFLATGFASCVSAVPVELVGVEEPIVEGAVEVQVFLAIGMAVVVEFLGFRVHVDVQFIGSVDVLLVRFPILRHHPLIVADFRYFLVWNQWGHFLLLGVFLFHFGGNQVFGVSPDGVYVDCRFLIEESFLPIITRPDQFATVKVASDTWINGVKWNS